MNKMECDEKVLQFHSLLSLILVVAMSYACRQTDIAIPNERERDGATLVKHRQVKSFSWKFKNEF